MFPLSSPAFSFSAVNVTHRQQLQLFTKRWPPRSCLMSTRRGAKRSAPDTTSTLKLKSEPKPVYCAPSVSEVVSSIEEKLAAIGDPKHAVQAERYLRGVAHVIQIVDSLWVCPQRDMQYTAMDVLKKTQKVWTTADGDDVSGSPVDMLDCLVRCVRDRPWWDTVGILCTQGFGPLYLAHPSACRPVMHDWSDSENMWERRVSILFQLLFKKATDEAFLFEVIRKSCSSNLSNEFFIQKAIGWSLRTYRRTSPASVDIFIATEESKLSKLSLREARK